MECAQLNLCIFFILFHKFLKYQAAETWTSQKFQKLSDPLKWAKLYQSFPAPITSAVFCWAADFIQMNSNLKHTNKYLCKTL